MTKHSKYFKRNTVILSLAMHGVMKEFYRKVGFPSMRWGSAYAVFRQAASYLRAISYKDGICVRSCTAKSIVHVHAAICIGELPLNEFQTEGLASQVFPTLFPHGKGDPTCKGRPHCLQYLLSGREDWKLPRDRHKTMTSKEMTMLRDAQQEAHVEESLFMVRSWVS